MTNENTTTTPAGKIQKATESPWQPLAFYLGPGDSPPMLDVQNLEVHP